MRSSCEPRPGPVAGVVSRSGAQPRDVRGASGLSHPPTHLERIAAGDESATADCIRRYGALVWSLARRHCDSVADAEDMVQEIFIELWRVAGRFDPKVANEVTFIAMIARRRLIDRRRGQARRRDTEALPARDPLAARETTVETGDEVARVRQSMATLPAERREVLELSIAQGYSHERVAERLGMPLGTVKSHARRGLQQIRELLRIADRRGGEA